jgi:hypothetical protein
MENQHTPGKGYCPEAVRASASQTFCDLLAFCEISELTFWEFEQQLFVLMADLGRALVRLFLTARHQRLDLEPHLQDRKYRLMRPYAERTLKTAYGPVIYGRAHLMKRRGGSGFYPLDALLGLTRDRLSPWMMQLVARLATRMSFAAAHLLCKAIWRWSPATETIERVVLGWGREAEPFMRQLPAPADDGEVLIIEEDGKCPPMATEAELAKRRGRRQPQDQAACSCGCQRHRGRCQRQRRGPKKRRKKGDHGKNGKEVMVVVMYTLRRGTDGKLHGPINKKVWASFTGRKAAAQWARDEATKRGFGPGTNKTVQIITDGAYGLRDNLAPLFPDAIFTLDACHVVEKLWDLGHCFHKEASPELKAWVAEQKTLLYSGQAGTLVQQLKAWFDQVPLHGPGTKRRRQVLKKLIGYLEPRLDMMRYQEWIEQDLVIGSGQVEGAVRHVVGERLDCAGMRWTQGKAEPLLHLRCIELNGDWDRFVAWCQQRQGQRLLKRLPVKILTDRPVKLAA